MSQVSDQPPVDARAGWPMPVRVIASLLLLFHLVALAALGLASESGPWVFPDEDGNAHPPFFAQKLFASTRQYRQALHLIEDYRFASNELSLADHRIEIRCTPKESAEGETLKFPDPGALPGTRHRQSLIARVLADYKPLEPPAGEKIPPPGQRPNVATYWMRTEDGSSASLVRVPEHLLPRDQALVAPTDYSMILARSLARHAALRTKKDKAEVVLISKPTYGPILVMPEFTQRLNVEPADFESVNFNFGTTP